MNKRNADKEKVDLMKWVNALKFHDPIHPNPLNLCHADPCEKAMICKVELSEEDFTVGIYSVGLEKAIENEKVAKIVVRDFLWKYCQ